MNFSFFDSNSTKKITSEIHLTAFLHAHRKSNIDFTRNRTLTFPRLVFFMLNAINSNFNDTAT